MSCISKRNGRLRGYAKDPITSGLSLEAFLPGHRRHGARLIQEFVRRKLSELGQEMPVFLTGDFNAAADAPEIRDLGRETVDRAGLIDAWRHAGRGEDRHGAALRGAADRARGLHGELHDHRRGR